METKEASKKDIYSREKIATSLIDNSTVTVDTSVYKEYTLIFTLVLDGSTKDVLPLSVYFDDIEAFKCFKYLNSRIYQLESGNKPIGMSFVCRNAKNEMITYGLTGVVQICHNIPQFEITDENE